MNQIEKGESFKIALRTVRASFLAQIVSHVQSARSHFQRWPCPNLEPKKNIWLWWTNALKLGCCHCYHWENGGFVASKANLKKITHDPSLTQESGTTQIATFLARRIHKMGQTHHQTRLQAGRNFASKPQELDLPETSRFLKGKHGSSNMNHGCFCCMSVWIKVIWIPMGQWQFWTTSMWCCATTFNTEPEKVGSGEWNSPHGYGPSVEFHDLVGM